MNENEAIRVLNKTLEEYKSSYAESVEVKKRIEREPTTFTWKWEDRGYWVLIYENHPKRIKELNEAITALLAKSEVDKKIRKICEYYDSKSSDTDNLGLIGKMCVAREILEILEG